METPMRRLIRSVTATLRATLDMLLFAGKSKS
jgi:isocitrate dehydrogenase